MPAKKTHPIISGLCIGVLIVVLAFAIPFIARIGWEAAGEHLQTKEATPQGNK